MEHQDAKQLKLTDDKRHQAVHEYLFELVRSEPQLYYASTDEVAHRLVDIIRERADDMSIEEQKLLKSLTVTDIDEILSFHSRKK